MSGGQQQMLSLGQAIVCRPKFILADEMSLGLAPLIVKRLMSVISRLASQGTGILLIRPCRSPIGGRGARHVAGPVELFGRSQASD